MGKVGRPKVEDSSVKSIRLPNRLWKLIKESGISYRSTNEFITRVIESHLIKNGFLTERERKFPITNSNPIIKRSKK
jgi:hypothetical protein|tara:strand:- start:16 stop:246 length:231 start_codon:yes stop_codon:yes gene_type:complete